MEFFSAQNITKQFSNHKALDEVSINVPENSIFGLLGPNGAGKTTLIRIINQITAPDSGQLFFEGEKLHPDHIEKIGYLPEERGLYKKMKVGEQAIYLAQLKGMSKKDVLKKLKYWFEKFEMQSWWNKKVEELSKGMQQKIQFVITVLHEPPLLIFDEPFTGFDPINTNLIKNEIINLRNNGATIIFSTHNMESVEELCDHIALIDNAKKILDGPVSEIRKTYRSNTYEIGFSGDVNAITDALSTGYEIAEHQPDQDKSAGRQDDEFQKIRVKITNQGSTNELLQKILSHIEIQSFNEVIPSMRDVFIEVVNKSKSDF